MSVLPLQPPTEAEINLIERGRAAFTALFPNQDYDDRAWSIEHLKNTGAGAGNANLHFSRLDRTGGKDGWQPFAKRYSDVIKANLATSQLAPGSMVNRLEGARWLWEAILGRLSAEAFTWQALRKTDAERAEEMMIAKGLQPSSVYRRCVYIATLLEELACDGIIAPMAPAFTTPRTEDSSRHTIAGREARSQKLLTQRAIDALIRLFRGEFALSPVEQLISCVTALLFATSLRIQEILQLPVDALRVEGGRYFLYYFKAKSQTVIEEKIVLSKLQAELAKEAIDKAMQLTADARKQAAVLVQSPDMVPLPEWAQIKRLLTKEEVARLTGVQPKLSSIPNEITRVRNDTDAMTQLDREALQAFRQGLRQRHYLESIRGVTKTESGDWMALDRALFLVFHNQGHTGKATNTLLVGLLGQQQVGDFLGEHKGRPGSIFQRLGLTEKNGQTISINSHQLRHYVTTKASGAGIPDVYIMRWQRREHAGDIEAYKHLTAEERIKQLHEAIKDGRLAGEVATMYFAVAESERDIFLEGVVQAMHLTHFGFCVHDFNTAPCPKAMNCIKGCGSFLFDPNDPGQVESIKRARHLNAVSLDEMKKAMASGGAAYAGAWIRDAEETIAGADRLLISTASSGEFVRPFADQPSKFQELG